MYCPRCGTKNPDGAAFCGGCGARIEVPNTAQTQATPAQEQPEQDQVVREQLQQQYQQEQTQQQYQQDKYQQQQQQYQQYQQQYQQQQYQQQQYQQQQYQQQQYQQQQQQYQQQYRQQQQQSQQAPGSTATISLKWDKKFTDARHEKLCRFVFSPLAIIAAATFTLMIILRIAGSTSIVSDTFNALLGNYLDVDISDLTYYLGDYLDGFDTVLSLLDSSVRAIVFCQMLPNIVIAVGLWMTIWSAFDKRQSRISLGGITAIKIITVIDLVFAIISVVLDVIMAFIMTRLLCFKPYEYIVKLYGGTAMDYWTDETGELFVFLLFLYGIIILYALFNVFYRFKVFRTVQSFEGTVNNNDAWWPSSLVGVMSFVSAIGQVFMLILTGDFAYFCGAAAYTCFGMLVFKFSNVLKWR